MPPFLVLRSGVPHAVVEAEDSADAWQQAAARWADVTGVVPLDEPAVRAVLNACLYRPPAPSEDRASGTPGKGGLCIWVDGSSLGNPGPAGWSYVRSDGEEASGSLGVSTNNAAELTAVLRALESVPAGKRVTILTDSRNVVGWLQDGWKRNDPGVQKLAGAIDQLLREKGVRMRLRHIAGHAGEPGNERAHQLATQAAKQQARE